MDNLETLATSSIQDTGGQQTNQKHNTENYKSTKYIVNVLINRLPSN
jgi:hypothetical protein